MTGRDGTGPAGLSAAGCCPREGERPPAPDHEVGGRPLVGGRPDPRYRVAVEFSGAIERAPGLRVGQRWVARWCGAFIGAALNRDAAWYLCRAHQYGRHEQVRTGKPCGFTGVFGYAYTDPTGRSGSTLIHCPTVAFPTATSVHEAQQMARALTGVKPGDVICPPDAPARTVTEVLVSVKEMRW